MANKMIIDASHPEETRVVVLRGNRVEEFDFESASKKPLRGNIYLAKVTRVEPSLQAAFVDYGGNRHGFLAFSEIHPDYYQIPIADRQALLEEEARSQRDDEEEPSSDRRSRRHRRPRTPEAEFRSRDDEAVSELAPELALSADSPQDQPEHEIESSNSAVSPIEPRSADEEVAARLEPRAHDEPPVLPDVGAPNAEAQGQARPTHAETHGGVDAPESQADLREFPAAHEPEEATAAQSSLDALDAPHDHDDAHHGHDEDDHEVTTLEGGAEERAPSARKARGEDEGEAIEHVGGDALEEIPRRAPRLRRQYKIQEVIKRRQVLLVQVVKEERGNKGAALTTYLSLAGRYSVLMPNTARGGGISRKITNAQDRSRLKSIAEELDVPEGMGVILRTAGASRTKAEVKRDFEYLLRMWETVRETTLASSAPTLVYEEGSLIKRAIRDLYSKDVEEIVVAGEAGFREAKEFMRLLMPSHARSVQLYRDVQPVFAKAGVEAQLDAMFSNQVTLKSGGYIVINQTEALVAIDVNSGRSTREHNIEDTAVRTNMEAADEIARQLRLRDLAGLIVVDFIDMEESRNNRTVERRMKDALKNDRARIQVGRISHFGLLEMSRQRIRTGVLEGSTVICQHCQGAGVVRSTASVALHVLRVLEDALIKSATHDMTVRTRTPVALYILNQKRSHLRDIERRFGVVITVAADDTLTGSNYHVLERGELASGVKAEDEAQPRGGAHEIEQADLDDEALAEAEDLELEAEGEEDGQPEEEGAEGERAVGSGEESEVGRRRRRRRRRRGGERINGETIASDAPQPADDGLAIMAEIGGDLASPAVEGDGAEPRGAQHRGDAHRRRRSRRTRGGNRDRRPERDGIEPAARETGEGVETAGRDAGDEAFGEANLVADQAASETPPFAAPSVEETRPLAAPVEEVRPHAAPVEVAASAPSHEQAPPAAEISPPAPPAAAAEAAAPASSPPPDEAARPRRAGWWQRARATIVGQ